MKLHYIEHVPFEGLGSIGDWAAARGAEISCTRVYAGEQLPARLDIDLLVVMGGPMGVGDEREYPWLREEKAFLRRAIDADVKIVGVCLGSQLLAEILGGRVFPNDEKEIGWFPIEVVSTSSEHPIAKILASAEEVFHWHGDTFELPSGAVHLARSAGCKNQAFAVGETILGFQFHLEATHSSARALVDNCGHDLIDSRFVQPADDMLEDNARFERINRLMEACLNHFVG